MAEPCKWIQDQLDILQQEISDYEDALNEVPPSSRHGILIILAELRTQALRLFRQLQRCLRLSLDGMEIAQAIQNMGQSVNLVSQKATVVRIYLSRSVSPTITVRGEITLSRSGSTPVTVPSLNTVVLDSSQAGQLDTKRRSMQLSLNFQIPADQTAEGLLSVALASVRDANTGVPLDIGGLGATRTITFVASVPLRVRILGIRYPYGNPPVTHVPSALDFSLINSWLKRAYPVAEVISSQAIIDATAAPPFGCGDINAQIAAIRAQDVAAGADKRTHYFGLVSDGGFFMRGCAAGIPQTPDPSTVASGPTGPATWGWDFDGSYGDWYTGHELGHTFGRYHPGSGCGESSDDPSFPFPKGQLANADDAFVGLDVGDSTYSLPMVALPGTDWHDVMTYCQYQWLCSYTYEGIRSRLVAENNLPHGPSPVPKLGPACGGRPDQRFPEKSPMAKSEPGKHNLIHVVASVNLTKQEGHIRFVNPLLQGEISASDSDSPVVLRVKRAGGLLPHDYHVAVKLLSCASPGDDRLGLVDATLAVDPEARIIELIVAGHSVDTFHPSATPPGVRNLKHVNTEEHPLGLTWETNAKADDNHTYTVQVSTDEGKTWQTLAVGLRTAALALDRKQFHGVKSVLVRVVATDGFTTSTVTSERLTVDL